MFKQTVTCFWQPIKQRLIILFCYYLPLCLSDISPILGAKLPCGLCNYGFEAEVLGVGLNIYSRQ